MSEGPNLARRRQRSGGAEGFVELLHYFGHLPPLLPARGCGTQQNGCSHALRALAAHQSSSHDLNQTCHQAGSRRLKVSAGDTSPRQAIKDHPMLPTLLDPEGAHGPKWHSSIRQVARQSRPIGGEAIHQSSGTRGAGHARVTRVRVERDSSRVVGSYVVARS